MCAIIFVVIAKAEKTKFKVKKKKTTKKPNDFEIISQCAVIVW